MNFKKFRIGNSSEINSKLGYGCWGIGGGTKELPSYGEIDADYAIHCLLEAKKKKLIFLIPLQHMVKVRKSLEVFCKKLREQKYA